MLWLIQLIDQIYSCFALNVGHQNCERLFEIIFLGEHPRVLRMIGVFVFLVHVILILFIQRKSHPKASLNIIVQSVNLCYTIIVVRNQIELLKNIEVYYCPLLVHAISNTYRLYYVRKYLHDIEVPLVREAQEYILSCYLCADN